MSRRTPRMASTALDIEHPFDAGSRRNRTDVPVAEVPRRRTQCPATRCRRRRVGSAKEPRMAMIRVQPVEVHVRTGWFDGSPREITWGDQRLPVTRLAAVREEAAAYPVITGPRTMFEVETRRARFALTYQH